jgi:hypothetical protein
MRVGTQTDLRTLKFIADQSQQPPEGNNTNVQNGWMDFKMWHAHRIEYYSTLKKSEILKQCTNMNEPRWYRAEWNNPGTKKQVLRDDIYGRFQVRPDSRAGDRRPKGSHGLMGRVLVGQNGRIVGTDGDDGQIVFVMYILLQTPYVSVCPSVHIVVHSGCLHRWYGRWWRRELHPLLCIPLCPAAILQGASIPCISKRWQPHLLRCQHEESHSGWKKSSAQPGAESSLRECENPVPPLVPPSTSKLSRAATAGREGASISVHNSQTLRGLSRGHSSPVISSGHDPTAPQPLWVLSSRRKHESFRGVTLLGGNNCCFSKTQESSGKSISSRLSPLPQYSHTQANWPLTLCLDCVSHLLEALSNI